MCLLCLLLIFTGDNPLAHLSSVTAHVIWLTLAVVSYEQLSSAVFIKKRQCIAGCW